MPPFNNNNQGGLRDLPPLFNNDSIGIGDVSNIIANLTNSQFPILQGLQGQSIDTLQGILGGNSDLTRRLSAPGIAGIRAQTPGVLRQLGDQLPSGGLQQQARANAITGETDQIADFLGQTNNGLVGPALNQLFTNQNILPQLSGPLLGIGGLRASEKAARGGGGKGK